MGFEREAKRQQSKLNGKFKIVHGQTIRYGERVGERRERGGAPSKPELSSKEELADQIISEIEERRQHLLDMKEALSEHEQVRIRMEMASRLKELSRLESGRGNENGG